MPALSKHQWFQTDKAGHCWPDPVMDSLHWPVKSAHNTLVSSSLDSSTLCRRAVGTQIVLLVCALTELTPRTRLGKEI